MSDHKGAPAMDRCAPLGDRVIVVALAALLAGGCNVIKPDLLPDVPDDAPMMMKPSDDALLHDAMSIDAPPDAYVPASGNLVPNPGFELMETTGWTNSGHGTIGLSSGSGHTGTKCLLTTERTANWNGPAAVMTAKVRPGRKYAMTAFARLMVAGSEGFNVSLRTTCAETGQHFNDQTSQHAATVTDNITWAQPNSTFTLPSEPACTLTEVLIYVETTTDLSPSTSYPAFYVDDLEVTEVFP